MLSHLKFGEPLSRLHSSLVDNDFVDDIGKNKRQTFDEYGFVLEKAEKLAGEEQKQREEQYLKVQSRWIAYLGTEHDKLAGSTNSELSKFEIDIDRSPLLDELISLGITDELRPFFWTRFAQINNLKATSDWTYEQLLDLSAQIKTMGNDKILQVLPNNACYQRSGYVACDRLKAIMRIFKWYRKTDPSASIDDQLNILNIGAHMLLMCNEQDAFWLLLKILKTLNIDELIEYIVGIMGKCCPTVSELLAAHDIQFKIIAGVWFGNLFTGIVGSPRSLFNIWDLYFYEGPVLLIQLIIGLMIRETRTLELCSDSAKLFNTLSDLPATTFSDLDKIVACWKAGKNIVSTIQLPGYLFHYPQTKNTALVGASESKFRNVKQTSLIINLHEAIAAIANHFQAFNLESKYNLEPDYDKVDDADEREDMNNRLRIYKQRAKALFDFAKTEKDELSFLRNDLITIINDKDEHCWVGELDGKIGWFPAKFVEKLNERDRNYCAAGDDSVVPFINDLVRGKLCLALKKILTYDLRKSYFFNSHPWQIIEEVSNEHSANDLPSIVSKIVLSKTFRLEEMAHVLTPAELLFRSIAYVKHTHPNAPLDVRLRSLICLGLNQYVLHNWWELVVTSRPAIIARYYGQASYLTTPAWKLIKAELK